jgi:sugar lactone lactonase YvrE
MKQHRLQTILPWLARLASGVGALALSLFWPPIVDFQRAPLPALGLGLLGLAGLMLPALLRMADAAQGNTPPPRGRAARATPPAPVWSGTLRRGWWHTTLQIAGFLLLWGVIGWCVLSQPVALDRALLLDLSLHALPIVALAGVAALLLAPAAWQRRALLALTVPSLLALGVVAYRTVPNVTDFRPYWLAVDARGTLYVSDVESPVIRVFAPDGTLQAKLRPRLSARKGVPGIGFSPPGPWNDPNRLGVPNLNRPPAAGWLRPWKPSTDEFIFCGMTLDPQDRLYVLDWLGNQMLRFTPDGALDALWPLPADYQPAFGCLASDATHVYVGDDGGQVLTYDFSGHLLDTQTLPGHLRGLSADHAGHLYALLDNAVWRETLATQETLLWALPVPSGALGFPYETLLALNNGQLLVSDLNHNRLLRFSGDGRLLGSVGGPGNQPGQFASLGALALGPNNRLYVTDSDHRVVQRLTLAGAVDGLYRGPDDDEND